jgi:hypothetical protein
MVIGGIMGFFDFLDSDEEKRKKELEDEMDLFGLEDWEKEEVRKGNYSPENFEEEDLEEDDYYFDN